MIEYIAQAEIRLDFAGDGRFGSSRDGGSRRHNGIDYVVPPGSIVLAPVSGEVNKIGYAYGDDLSWRYVQIRDKNDLLWRIFYVSPDVSIGDFVTKGESILGESVDISLRYPGSGMKPHIHLGVKDGHKHLNPEEVEST